MIIKQAEGVSIMENNGQKMYRLLDELLDEYKSVINSAYCGCEIESDLIEKIEDCLKNSSSDYRQEIEGIDFHSCQICKKKFKRKDDMIRHFRDSCSKNFEIKFKYVDGLLECPKCNKKFKHINNLRQHYLKTHLREVL